LHLITSNERDQLLRAVLKAAVPEPPIQGEISYNPIEASLYLPDRMIADLLGFGANLTHDAIGEHIVAFWNMRLRAQGYNLRVTENIFGKA